MALTFNGTLREESGAFVEVPPDVLAELGPRKRPAVRVVISRWGSPLGKICGTFYADQTFS